MTAGESSPFVKQTQEGTSEEPHYDDHELIDEHNNYVCEGETKDKGQIDGIPIQSLRKEGNCNTHDVENAQKQGNHVKRLQAMKTVLIGDSMIK